MFRHFVNLTKEYNMGPAFSTPMCGLYKFVYIHIFKMRNTEVFGVCTHSTQCCCQKVRAEKGESRIQEARTSNLHLHHKSLFFSSYLGSTFGAVVGGFEVKREKLRRSERG